MSNSKTVKKATVPLRVVHGTATQPAATLDQLRGYVEVANFARKRGIDLRVQLQVGATSIAVANDASVAVAATVEELQVPAERFTKVSKEGKALPLSATDWEGVYDFESGLIWGRTVLPDEHNWKDALKKASETTLCGAPARAPTVKERFEINDLTKHSPALDTRYFAKDSGWEWTSTVDAGSPSGCAWIVGLGRGFAFRHGQGLRFLVRAVRAGQPIGL
jgi:hypothetical protein